jgi:hypothetical protein
MFRRRNLVTLTIFLLFSAVAVCGFMAGTAHTPEREEREPGQDLGQGAKKIQVETRQLPPEGGVIPVELKCGQAELSAPNALDSVPCVIRNNTGRLVKAVGVTETITTERDGITSTLSSSTVIDAFVHPDINAERGGKLIPPGQEINAGGLPASYSGMIKGVVLAVGYVEFDGGIDTGPDITAFRRKIAEFRSGAAKYKKWLAQQFNRRDKKVSELTALLEREPTPEETGAENNNEAEGASVYRNFALKVKKEKGVRALAEQLQ